MLGEMAKQKKHGKIQKDHGNVRRGRWVPAVDFTGGNGAYVGGFAGDGVAFDGGDGVGGLAGTLAGAGAGTGTLAYGGNGACNVLVRSISTLQERSSSYI